MEAFCKEQFTNGTAPALTPDLLQIKDAFTILQVTCCIFGVLGNILNLRTLQSPSLQTVPFMYIRSLAYFDLIALTMILLHFGLVSMKHNIHSIMYYTTYIEAPVINTFLIAGLYCAFLLTVERHLLISRPHNKSTTNPRPQARRKINLMLLVSFCIHLPMVLQRTLQLNANGDYVMVNNVDLLCSEPNWTIYSYYKLARECLRFCIVILMTLFNIIIARQLQLTKQRRRRLVRRSSPQNESPNGLENSESTVSSYHIRKEESNLMRSFTEKKLTVLMIVICIIFLLGNVPQIIVMILQNEAMEHNFQFQVYRHVSNTLEVLNHCLNFYVFCIASSEYTRAFLLNCSCLQRVLYQFPSIARFMASRRSSSVMINSSGGFGVPNKEYLSMESIPEEAKQWVVDPSSSPYAQVDSSLKSILVTGNRETRQKKSLTIVNHNAAQLENSSHHDAEIL